MKTTIHVAKTELKLLFFSPIAWFLLIVFFVQCSLGLVSRMEQTLMTQELGGQFLKGLSFLTGQLYSGHFGVLNDVVRNIYLYIPLLTMGLMSRETNSGTIRLLYSSPIRVWQIVCGKFMAMAAYSCCLIAILVVFTIAGGLLVPSFDYSLVLSGLLGIFLLLCAYAAIGLFMSCLTTYQIVAAISTFVVFAVLAYIGTVWQGLSFVRDLTYFLSISGRVEKMISGLISTNDVLYFLVIIAMFLAFSICRLRDGRESSPWYLRSGRYALILIFALLAGYTGSRPALTAYYDATATKSMTLTARTQKIIQELDSPLEVTSYINLLDQHYFLGAPDQRNQDMNRWLPYLRFKPDITFKYVYYYDSTDNPNLYKYNPGKTIRDLALEYVKSLKTDLSDYASPEEIRKRIDLRSEGGRYVMQLRYKGRTTFLRLFNDILVFPSETETSAALKRLTVRLPKIAFLEDEQERRPDKAGDRDYLFLTSQRSFRYALINQGFDIETISLQNGEIPTDLSVLVIADPRSPFSPDACAKIMRYINKGGNLLIAGEPGRQALLNPLLQPLGVKLMEGIIVQQSRDYDPSLVLPYLTKPAAGFSTSLQQDFDDSAQVSMPGVTALSYADTGAFHIEPLLMTDDKTSWLRKQAFTADSSTLVYRPQEGDDRRPLPAALSLTRMIDGKQQRIIVTGDADFMNNSELGRSNVETDNFTFNTSLFGWFTYKQFPIDASRPKGKDNRLHLTQAGLTALRILLLGVFPGLVLIAGSILLVRRKRK